MAEATAKTASDTATSGTTAGGQTSFTEHADKRSADHTFESRTVDSDIGQTEGWSTNFKRIVDDYAHMAARVHVDSLDVKNRLAEIAMQDWQARLADERVATKSFYNVSQNGWNNLTDEEKRIMAQETRHSDLAMDRQWNLDEQNQMAVAALREIVSSGNLNTDALVAAIKAVFDGVKSTK